MAHLQHGCGIICFVVLVKRLDWKDYKYVYIFNNHTSIYHHPHLEQYYPTPDLNSTIPRPSKLKLLKPIFQYRYRHQPTSECQLRYTAGTRTTPVT